MPTYGYRCTACGHEFERVQKITEPALTECETCSGPVKKMIYPVGIQFVGSGFYVNDYNKSGGSKANASASSGSEPASPAPATESKPGESSTSTPTPAPAAAAAPAGGDTK